MAQSHEQTKPTDEKKHIISPNIATVHYDSYLSHESWCRVGVKSSLKILRLDLCVFHVNILSVCKV